MGHNRSTVRLNYTKTPFGEETQKYRNTVRNRITVRHGPQPKHRSEPRALDGATPLPCHVTTKMGLSSVRLRFRILTMHPATHWTDLHLTVVTPKPPLTNVLSSIKTIPPPQTRCILAECPPAAPRGNSVNHHLHPKYMRTLLALRAVVGA